MTLRTSIVVVLVAMVAAGSYVLAHRYEVVVGGSSRYYAVIKIDRITGQAWKLDMNGRDWNAIEHTD